jgi:tetratricopeptide (TPR) repeat protein
MVKGAVILQPLIKHFGAMTREQILELPPGKWDDEELLKASKYFQSEKKDRDRAMAAVELILRSPQLVGLDYEMPFLDLIGYYTWKGDFPAALRWAHAHIAFEEQQQSGLNRANHVSDLAETYLRAGDLDTGLALFTRLAQRSPGDIWHYNVLGLDLPRTGLPGLAAEILDHAQGLVRDSDPERLAKQFADQRRMVAEMLSAGAPDHTSEISPDVLADFRNAFLQPAGKPKKQSNWDHEKAPYLPPVSRLITVEQAGSAALEAEILARGKVMIPELIELAFDQEFPAQDAPAHAVRLLRKMRDANIAELGELSPWLDRASGNWHHDLLTRSFGKIGGYSTSELEAIVADAGASTATRIGAEEALAERVEGQRKLRKRFVAFIRTMLTRPEADRASEETIVGFLISDALKLNARELYPEIERAFVEDRVDTAVVDPLSIQQDWGLLPVPQPEHRSDGMYLRLQCTACNRIREHFVQDVLLEVNTLKQQRDGQPTAYDPYIMDREIVCPKCGAVDHYAMTPKAHLTLALAPTDQKVDVLQALLGGQREKPNLPPNPRLHPFRSNVFGRPMHPLAGLQEYRRQIADHPRDARLYMKMGNLLRTLLRSADALNAHRKAYALNQNDAEIALTLACSEHDFGDPSEAKKMYERVLTLERQPNAPWSIPRPNSFSGAALEGQLLLKQRQPSPWAPPTFEPVPGASTLADVDPPAPPVHLRKHRQRKRR